MNHNESVISGQISQRVRINHQEGESTPRNLYALNLDRNGINIMVDQSAKVNRTKTSSNSDFDESQLYYWTREWQDSEKQARADIQAGRVTKLNGIDEIEAHFGQLAKQSQAINEERNDVEQ